MLVNEMVVIVFHDLTRFFYFVDAQGSINGLLLSDLELSAEVDELDGRVTMLNGTMTDTVHDVTELTEQMLQLLVDGKFPCKIVLTDI